MREAARDQQRLKHIIEPIDNIFEFISDKSFADFENEKMLRFAIIKNLEIVGEAAYMITPELKLQHHEIPWEDIVAMRHILVHDYYQIKNEIVWLTIQSDLPSLKKQIGQLILS